MLNDNNLPASCESDLNGAVSMFIGMQLSGGPVFFGDPVSLDEKANTVTYWHCGTAACSLARTDTGAEAGVHPNRKIGPTMEFGCKPASQVTVFRIGRNPDSSFRFFIASGEAVDVPKQFLGTSVVVKTANSAADLINDSVSDGWEPHFVVIYADVAAELEALANMLDMDVYEY
jgi:L-fucose isomerase-like protein